MLTFSACSDIDSDSVVPQIGKFSYRMKLDCASPNMDGMNTRANTGWKNNDTIWVTIVDDTNTPTNGTAVYNSATDDWDVTLNREIPSEGTMSLNYVENALGSGVDDNGQKVIYTNHFSTAYEAITNFTLNWKNEIVTSATLLPDCFRVRFKGEAGTSFSLKGLSYLTTHFVMINSAVLGSVDEEIELTVDQDGYTPYIYPHLIDSTEVTITLTTSDGIYSKELKNLEHGKTGCITLPSPDSAAVNGWTYTYVGVPQVSTVSVNLDSISAYVCSLGYEILNNGNSEVTESGYLIIEAGGDEPTLENYADKLSASAASKYEYSKLKPSTAYIVRAYAINSSGVGYGPTTTFTAQSITTPTVVTAEVTNIFAESFTANGSVSDLGMGSILEWGFVYSTTNSSPTLENGSKVYVTPVSGKTVTKEISNLSPNTTYYVRAFATNEKETGYGEVKIVTTMRINPDQNDNDWPIVNGAKKR